ncbi:MAG: ribonuclease J, partial [Candidatus Binatia bacterium]
MSDARLRLVPLGGLGEIGLNLMLLELHSSGGSLPDAALAIDCGVMFPTAETPGIDLVIPDLGYLRTLGSRLLGVALTHGHEDHIGGLPFLLREQPMPVWGSAFTIGLVTNKLAEHGIGDEQLHVFEPGARFEVGPFGVEPLHMTHSIVDAAGFAVHTPLGTVVHTGDFKIDHTPVDGRTSDLDRLAELGAAGVLLLLSDSTNVGRPGTTPSERSVAPALEHVFMRSRGKVVAATFASHVHRLQQVIEVSARHERKVALLGRSLIENVRIARGLGKLEVPADAIASLDEVQKLPAEHVTLLTTGSQGEPRSALARLAAGDLPDVTIEPGDSLVLSARVIPGNERAVTTLVNHAVRRGAEVFREEVLDVHTSGHASQEELKLVLRLVRPKYFVPVHGEYRHLARHVRLAVETGVEAERCFLLEDGESLVFDDKGARRDEPVPHGRVFVDGKGIGDVEELVLRDRRHLAEGGLVLVVLGVDRASGDIVVGPDLLSRGFVLEGSSQGLLDEARAAVVGAVGAI